MSGTLKHLLVSITSALALGAAACTVPSPAPAPADPLISCSSVGGDISYTPPAQGIGETVVLDALPGAALSGCTDHTGAAITGGSLDVSIVMPNFTCGGVVTLGTELGNGSGTIGWTDGSASSFDATIFATGGQSGFLLELTITAGRWTGARTSFVEVVTGGTGYCAPGQGTTQATLALLESFELRPGRTPRPSLLADTTQVSAGDTHSCARSTSGHIRCWGANTDGQLGNLLMAAGSQSTIPVEVTGINTAVDVSAGGRHTCAVVAGGVVECWGDNISGQLGNGSTIDSTAPIAVPGIVGAERVEAGQQHSCAIVAGGEVRCWGANGAGQLGDGTFVDRPTPVAVTGISGATKLALGSAHSCALLSSGEVRCWGYNHKGQLGDGTTATSNVPVAVPANPSGPSTDLSAGTDHTCDMQAASPALPFGQIRCWGWNRYGQLGNGPAGDFPVTTPTAIGAALSSSAIDAGGTTSCARLGAGSVSCWGSNAFGSLGSGWSTGDPTGPAWHEYKSLVFGLRDAQSISTGGSHGCAVVGGGQVRCWGANHFGQLGDATTRSATVPVAVAAGP